MTTFVLGALAGCNSLNDNQRELADIAGQTSANRTVEATNADLVAKAKKAEQDLTTLENFYQGVSGEYSGTFTPGTSSDWTAHYLVTATVPRYGLNEDRPLDRINADIANLHLTVHAAIERNDQLGEPITCTFMNITPNLVTGEIDLSDSNCPFSNTVFLLPSGGISGGSGAAVAGNSSAVASSLLQARTTEAPGLAITLYLGSNVQFTVKRDPQVQPSPHSLEAEAQE